MLHAVDRSHGPGPRSRAPLPSAAVGDAASRWESDVVLADGGTVHVRPIRPDDAERLVAFHGRLSPESIYFRFFSPKPRLTDKEIEKFTTVDMRRPRRAGGRCSATTSSRWPATTAGPAGTRPRWPSPSTTPTTAGAWPRCCSSTSPPSPASTGSRRFTAEVLPDNRPMLGVFRAGRLRGPQRVLRRHHRRRLRHRPDAALPRVGRPPRAARREPLHRPAPAAPVGRGHRRLRPRRARSGARSSATCSTAASTGPVYPVNPTTPHVASVPAYASVLDIPDDVHLAVVAVPADGGAGRHRPVRREAGAGRRRRQHRASPTPGPRARRRERELVELARGNGMRIIGPASMGVDQHRPDARRCTPASPRSTCPPAASACRCSPARSAPAMIELADRLGVGLSHVRVARQQGRRERQRPPQLLVRRPGHRRRAALHRELRQPAQVRPHRPAGVAPQADRGREVRARLARRRRRRRALPAGRRDPGRHRARAVRRRAGARRPAAARTGDRVAVRDQLRQPGHAGPRRAAGQRPRGRPSCRSTPAPSSAPPAGRRRDRRQPARPHLPARCRPTTASRSRPCSPTRASTPCWPSTRRRSSSVRHDVAGTIAEVAEGVGQARRSPSRSAATTVRSLPGSPVPAFAFPEPAVAALGRIVALRGVASAGPRARCPTSTASTPTPPAAIVDHAARGPARGHAAAAGRWPRSCCGTYGIPVAPARAVTSRRRRRRRRPTALGYPVALKAAGWCAWPGPRAAASRSTSRTPSELRGRVRAHVGGARPGDGRGRSCSAWCRAAWRPCATVEAHPAFGPVVAFGLGGAFADAIADRPARSLPLTDLDAAELVSSSRAAEALGRARRRRRSRSWTLLLRVGLPGRRRAGAAPRAAQPGPRVAEGAWVLHAELHVAPLPSLPVDPSARRSAEADQGLDKAP